jgi:hypothetical protein
MHTQVLPRPARRFNPRVVPVLLTLVLLGAFVSASQVQNVKADDGVHLTYTKWFHPAFPDMVGVVGGDVDGTFSGKVLDISTPGDKRFTYLDARYNIIANDRSKSFSAMIVGRQDNQKLTAVLNGLVTSGWLTGHRVRAQYTVFNCARSATGKCFTGTIRVTGDSEDNSSGQTQGS